MTPYEQGYKAYVGYFGSMSNPFPKPAEDAPDSDPFWQWYYGWLAADRDQQEAERYRKL